jgi:hypothetical protein
MTESSLGSGRQTDCADTDDDTVHIDMTQKSVARKNEADKDRLLNAKFCRCMERSIWEEDQ